MRLALLAVLMLPSVAHAQLHIKAISTVKNLKLRMGANDVVSTNVLEGHIERYQGEWAWFHIDGRSGWVKRTEVVPMTDAVNYFTNKISAEPTNVDWYQRRGIAWREAGELDGAISDITQAITLSPNEAACWNTRGTLLRAQGNYDAAIADYNQALRLRQDRVYWFNAGVAHIDLKQYDKAISSFDQALKLDPNYVDAWTWSGIARKQQGRFDEAVSSYNHAISLDPNDAGGYGCRAWLWATCKDAKFRDGKHAIQSATKACELTGWREAWAIENLAAAYAETGDFENAVKFEEKAIEVLAPGDKGRQDYLDHLKLFEDQEPLRE